MAAQGLDLLLRSTDLQNEINFLLIVQAHNRSMQTKNRLILLLLHFIQTGSHVAKDSPMLTL